MHIPLHMYVHTHTAMSTYVHTYMYLYSSVVWIKHELCQGHNLGGPIPTIRAMQQDGQARVMDHTHHFTGHTHQLAQVAQPLGALETGQETTGENIQGLITTHSP